MDLKGITIAQILPTIVNFLKISMKESKTTLHLNYTPCNTTNENLKIKCGTFQGDSLSLPLFCLVLVPLSSEHNKTGYGYHIYEMEISLFYLDDLILYEKNDEELEELLSTAYIFSNDISMEFGLDKCAKATFIR